MAESKNWNLAVSNEKINEEVSRFIAQESGIKNRLLLATVKSQKLENALSVHHLEKDEYPIFFYDDTLLGGGKDGFLITNKNVYVHEMFEESKKVAISELKTITNQGNSLLFNSIRAPVSWIDCKEMVFFLKSILIKKTEPKKSALKTTAKKSMSESKKVLEKKTKTEDKQPKKSTSHINKNPKSIEFKGLLYDDYKITKGTLIEDAVIILEKNGWFRDDEEEEDSFADLFDRASSVYTLYPPEEDATLYGFPLLFVTLIANSENSELAGIMLSFSKDTENDDEIIDFLNMKIIKKYNLLKSSDEVPAFCATSEEISMFGTKKLIPSKDYALMYRNSKTAHIVYSLFDFNFANPVFQYFRTAMLEKAIENNKTFIAEEKEKLINNDYDIDDLATIYYEYKPEYRFSQKKEPTEDFTRLLDKWEEILQREDVEITVRNPMEKIPNWKDASSRQTILIYKTPQNDATLRFEFGRIYYSNSQYTKECFLKLSYQKGKHIIEGNVHMEYPTGWADYETMTQVKLSFENLLAHIGRTDLAKLVAKFQAKKDAEDAERKRREEELEKQKWEQEQREQDEFEDDFDNL